MSSQTAIITSFKKKFVKASADEAFLENAKRLLAIRSTYERPAELKKALEFIVSIIKRHSGITVERFENNGIHSILAYYGKKRPERFTVVLNGHVDVVHGRDTEFQPYVENGRLYGRGALDMKVATLVMTEVFCRVASLVSYPLGLQITTDEEVGGYGGARHQFKYEGVSADFFITGEQSNNDVVVAAKGLCWLRIKQTGTASHGAYLWKGDNALLKLTELVRKIHEVYPVPSSEVWKTTASVAQLRTLTEGFFNRVPDAAELLVDFRFLPSDPHFASREAVQEFIGSMDSSAEIEFVTYEGAPFIEASHPLLQKLIAATEKYKEGPVKMIRRHGNSDMRHLLSDPHMRGIEYGLGGGFEHGDNEYLELSTVPVMRKALDDFLRTI